jgi:hypothetical protein
MRTITSRLTVVRPGDAANPYPVSKPVLAPLARLNVEQARKFLTELDTVAASSSPLLAMFLLGRCAEHAQALLDIIDATTELPR